MSSSIQTVHNRFGVDLIFIPQSIQDLYYRLWNFQCPFILLILKFYLLKGEIFNLFTFLHGTISMVIEKNKPEKLVLKKFGSS